MVKTVTIIYHGQVQPQMLPARRLGTAKDTDTLSSVAPSIHVDRSRVGAFRVHANSLYPSLSDHRSIIPVMEHPVMKQAMYIPQQLYCRLCCSALGAAAVRMPYLFQWKRPLSPESAPQHVLQRYGAERILIFYASGTLVLPDPARQASGSGSTATMST